MGVRKSARNLTGPEKAAFVAAVKRLKAQTTGRNYDWFVTTHMTYFAGVNGIRYAHQAPSFLPWHRQYLIEFERALQVYDPSVSVPYWDWTVDRSTSGAPFTADLLGGNGSGGNGPVTTGPFAGATNWRINVGSTTATSLRRAMGTNTLPTAAQVTSVLGVSAYDAAPWNSSATGGMRNRMEGWTTPNLHNTVHVWVGGHMGQQDSPNDPAFWLHHCNIDRLWSQWQTRWGFDAAHYVPASGTAGVVDLNEPLQPWPTVTPASVLQHSSIYTYA
ncbi:tyrosinase family protein [Actinoplanes awajinensis]|uniref:Tyrosinase n=1 Tax=Actinoplanes awajinensis subsp. mycoplanecinus TaxID=135947 RepID=A0A117MLS2_9ACTN|nr:tyrosinase family protein [Actinoplanes awajinensis]KUL24400.1 tyrosinase [Actinoplanes awajinensis subsp. mycoplanecinus]